MKITGEEIQNTAKLAKMKFTQDEAVDIAKEIYDILSDFDVIAEEEDITLHITEKENATSNFRRDEVQLFKEKEELFQNTKNIRKGYLELPKVVE